MHVLVLVSLALASLAGLVRAGESAEAARNMAKLDDQERGIFSLTAGIVNLQDRIDARDEMEAKASRLSQYYMARLDKSVGGSCPRRTMDCLTGNRGDCVSNAVCCDGKDDCANGADESDDICGFNPKPGQVYSGRFHYYHCVLEQLTDVSFVVHDFARREYSPGFADISGILSWVDISNPNVELLEKLPYEGIYTYGSRIGDFRIEYHGQVYHEHFYFPTGDQGYVIYTVREAASNRLCGKAIMTAE